MGTEIKGGTRKMKNFWKRILSFFWGIPEYKSTDKFKGLGSVYCRLCGRPYDRDDEMSSCPHKRRKENE